MCKFKNIKVGDSVRVTFNETPVCCECGAVVEMTRVIGTYAGHICNGEVVCDYVEDINPTAMCVCGTRITGYLEICSGPGAVDSAANWRPHCTDQSSTGPSDIRYDYYFSPCGTNTFRLDGARLPVRQKS